MVLLTFLINASLIVGTLAVSCKSVYNCVSEGLAMDLSPIVVEDLDSDPFYNPKDKLELGEALTLEMSDPDILGYDMPPGVTMYRMIYGSEDPDGNTVPASAFILIPYTWGEHEKFDVIAWAHGTSGIERLCAPSIQSSLYYNFEAPLSMALQGFAVIGPDYAGQGTNTTFHYLHGPAHAADMVNAVLAARNSDELKDVLSNKWVAVGHSEGGLTAWATNEREAKPGMSTPGFMGAVSLAPALANLKIISKNIKDTDGNLGETLLYPSYTLSTIKRFDPTVDVDKYYTPLGLKRRALADFGCFQTALGAFNNLTYQDVFETKDEDIPDWLKEDFAIDWQATTGVDGKRKIAKPMLIVAGGDDAAVPLKVIQDAFNTQCHTHKKAQQVYLSEYPGLDHDPVAWASQSEYFDWIRALFAGNNPKKHDACKPRLVEKSIPSSSFSRSGSSQETDDIGKRSFSIRGGRVRHGI